MPFHGSKLCHRALRYSCAQEEAKRLAARLGPIPERSGPLVEEAAREGFSTNREWFVNELRALSHCRKAVQDALLQVGAARAWVGSLHACPRFGGHVSARAFLLGVWVL